MATVFKILSSQLGFFKKTAPQTTAISEIKAQADTSVVSVYQRNLILSSYTKVSCLIKNLLYHKEERFPNCLLI